MEVDNDFKKMCLLFSKQEDLIKDSMPLKYMINAYLSSEEKKCLPVGNSTLLEYAWKSFLESGETTDFISQLKLKDRLSQIYNEQEIIENKIVSVVENAENPVYVDIANEFRKAGDITNPIEKFMEKKDILAQLKYGIYATQNDMGIECKIPNSAKNLKADEFVKWLDIKEEKFYTLL